MPAAGDGVLPGSRRHLTWELGADGTGARPSWMAVHALVSGGRGQASAAGGGRRTGTCWARGPPRLQAPPTLTANSVLAPELAPLLEAVFPFY